MRTKPTVSVDAPGDWNCSPLVLHLKPAAILKDVARWGGHWEEVAEGRRGVGWALVEELQDRDTAFSGEYRDRGVALFVNPDPFDVGQRMRLAAALDDVLSERFNGRWDTIFDWGTQPLRELGIAGADLDERWSMLQAAWGIALGPYFAGDRPMRIDLEVFRALYALEDRFAHCVIHDSLGYGSFSPSRTTIGGRATDDSRLLAAAARLVERGWLEYVDPQPANGVFVRATGPLIGVRRDDLLRGILR